MDTIVYELPVTLKPESIPQSVFLKTQFGEYKAKLEYSKGKLSYIRSFQLNKGQYPASEYASLVDFYDKISGADDMRCVLIKN